MVYEERRVVADEPATVETVEPANRTVVERVEQPVRRTIVSDDPVASAYAATQLIQTIVWSIVVLVLLFVLLWALHVYAHMF